MNGLPPSGFGPGRSVEPRVLAGADAEPPPRPHAVEAPAPRPNAFEVDVRQVLDEVARMLIEKNRAYGNSALEPVRVFSKASPVEQLLVRLDDKLSRLSRGAAAGEDVEKDLLGYLVLLRIARLRAQGEP